MDDNTNPGTPQQDALRAAHVLLDALSAFEGGRPHLPRPASPGREAVHTIDRDTSISLALERLADTDAVTVALDDESGKPRVDATPLLRASLTLITSLVTMLQHADPEVDDLTLITRLRTVVDLTLRD